MNEPLASGAPISASAADVQDDEISLIDLAIEILSTQYALEQDQANKTEESYRVFASTMNATLERERQHLRVGFVVVHEQHEWLHPS